MQTAQLIDSLSAQLTPARARPAAERFLPALALGASASLVAVVGIFGVQPGLGAYAHGAPLIMKAAYAGSLATMALALAATLARPGGSLGRFPGWIFAPVVVLAALAVSQLAAQPAADWAAMLLGDSWDRCPWRILLLSLPVAAGLVVAARREAPTRLRRTGAAIGLTSGATAAVVYALACTESSAAFVLVWYTLGIALSTLLGALAGPRLLRW